MYNQFCLLKMCFRIIFCRMCLVYGLCDIYSKPWFSDSSELFMIPVVWFVQTWDLDLVFWIFLCRYIICSSNWQSEIILIKIIRKTRPYKIRKKSTYCFSSAIYRTENDVINTRYRIPVTSTISSNSTRYLSWSTCRWCCSRFSILPCRTAAIWHYYRSR